jgi:uncharacterized protein YcbX
MALGAVVALWRYPVKSMLGEELDAVAAGECGLLGDRAYGLVDRASGKVASAKHPRLWGRLLACRAAGTAPAVRITLPDGRIVAADGDGADAALSAALGRAVALAASAPLGVQIERYSPDIEGLPLRGTLSAGAIGLGAPPGAFFDHAPVHLLTTATLDRLRALYPAGHFDARRFRPNLVVAPVDGAAGFVEDAWVGRTLLVGDAVRLRVTDPAPRCVMTTLPQAGLPQDLGVLRAVAAHHRPPIPALGGAPLPSAGVYAVVERGGALRRGDSLQFADGG